MTLLPMGFGNTIMAENVWSVFHFLVAARGRARFFAAWRETQSALSTK
jgi:hypothetical protein